jgi:uracil-DNA glycosylase
MTACPVCSQKIILPRGNQNAKILIVGGLPTEEDIETNEPFAGQMGAILRRALMRNAKLDVMTIRRVLLHLHLPSKGTKKEIKLQNNNCLQIGHDLVIEEAQNKKLVILVGAQAVKHFTGMSVDDTNGLTVPCEYWKAETFAFVSPGSVFSTVGEMRFACGKLKTLLEETK